MQRRLRALELVEQRELRSLETALLKERRIEERERTGREPAPIEPSPTHPDEFNEAAKKPIDLTAEFEKAAGSGEAEGGASGDSSQDVAPESEIKNSTAATHARAVAATVPVLSALGPEAGA